MMWSLIQWRLPAKNRVLCQQASLMAAATKPRGIIYKSSSTSRRLQYEKLSVLFPRCSFCCPSQILCYLLATLRCVYTVTL